MSGAGREAAGGTRGVLPPDAARRLAEVVARHRLDDAAHARLAAVAGAVAADPNAPTTIRAPLDVIDRHVADSLEALAVDAVRQATVIADLGAGVGFPGLALAAALPAARVHLVESVGRKAAWLGELAARAGIRNVAVVAARAEEWQEGLGAVDVVTARALAALPVVLEYAAPLLRAGGTLVAWAGRRDPEEERRAAEAALILGLSLEDVRSVRPFPTALERHLHLYHKVSATPERFPRRPGMAAKRPLGG